LAQGSPSKTAAPTEAVPAQAAAANPAQPFPTTVHASEVGLTIGSEKGDLRSLLGNEMPAIANNLQQQNLRLNNVSFTQGFASPNQGGGGNSQQQSFVPRPAYSATESGAASRDTADEGIGLAGTAAAGLNILA
jgi:hypothetical protein